MIDEIPKTIEFIDCVNRENRKMFYLKITYLPFNKMWEITYDDIFGSVTSWKTSYDGNFKNCILKMKKKMKELTKDLKKISTFAKERNVSVQAVYKWIERNEIQCIEIDGVKFIKDSKKTEEEK